MTRLLAIVTSAVFLLVGFFAASAKVHDPGPPYTSAQFLEISKERLAYDLRQNIEIWWAKAPEYLKKHILNTHSERWAAIIKCNYFGFRPDVTGPLNSAKCEEDDFQASQRGRNSWSQDGTWVGPSEACLKRNKRSKWGELICD